MLGWPVTENNAMSTHWTTGLVPPQRPVADGVARAEYLRRARNQRRTKGRSDWDKAKPSSKSRQATVYGHGGHGIPRLSQAAVNFLLRPKAGLLATASINGKAVREQETHLRMNTPRFSLNRVIRHSSVRTKVDGHLVRTFESRDMHAHRWDPVQARFVGTKPEAPRPTRAPLTAAELAERHSTMPDTTPGKELE